MKTFRKRLDGRILAFDAWLLTEFIAAVIAIITRETLL